MGDLGLDGKLMRCEGTDRVACSGGFLKTCNELLVLCPDYVSDLVLLCGVSLGLSYAQSTCS